MTKLGKFSALLALPRALRGLPRPLLGAPVVFTALEDLEAFTGRLPGISSWGGLEVRRGSPLGGK